MREDYLWDKTGTDAEIEELENALKAFRFEAKEPPQIGGRVLKFEPARPRRIFRNLRAIAASVAFFVTVGGLSLVLFSSGEQTAEIRPPESLIQPEVSPVENPAAPENNAPRNETAGLPVRKNLAAATTEKTPRRFKAQKLIFQSKPAETRSRKMKNEKAKLTLTAEEKEAYQKLMLALSITSSKLKLVKDTVQNLDTETAVYQETNTRKK
jgi:hypothetical protein